MAKGKSGSRSKQEQLRTRQMPSGAQQWVRGDSTADRMRTINDAYDPIFRQLDALREDRSPEGQSRHAELLRAMRMNTRAFVDESNASTAASRARNYKSGGPVCRGMGAATRGGKYKP
jgi:hypothetical protein